MKYSTNFASNENPLRESSAWLDGAADGRDWNNMKTVGGLAYGTQIGSTSYDDSVAVLAGSWSWHQRCRARSWFVTSGGDSAVLASGSAFMEIELQLHFTVTTGSITGYEATIACSSDQNYVQINRWNGAVGSFTLLGSATIPAPAVPHATTNQGNVGDLWEFRDEGTSSVPLLKVYQNGILVLTYNTSPDATKYTGGAPGIGHYDGQGGSAGPTNSHQADCGWTQFDATDDYFAGECVQSNKATSGSSGLSMTCAFSANVAQGNQLVVSCYDGDVTGTLTVTDSQGNVYSTPVTQDNTSDGHRIATCSATAKSSAACTVTATWTGVANNFRTVIVAEYKSYWIEDKTSGGQGSSAAPSSGSTATTSSATELCVGTIGGNNGSNSAGNTATNGYALRQNANASNGFFEMMTVDRMAYSAGAQAATGSIVSQNWSALIRTFQPGVLQSQASYRFRNDDGSETSATWRGPELLDAVLLVGSPFRLRFLINTTGDEPSQPLTLQFRAVGATAWTSISSTSRIRFYDSGNIAAAAATATTAL